jgi:hypothetical protein
MAIIETNEIIITAALTRLGRRILYEENDRFKISKFALSDDEINYNLVTDLDADNINVQILPIFEPSTNESNLLDSKLIRNADDLSQIAAASSYLFIPNTEIQIQTQLNGKQTFSLQNWNNDELTITLSLLDPTTNSAFLSDAFVVDFSEFYKKDKLWFDVFPVFPTALLGQPNKYWYIADDSFTDPNGHVLPVVVGIDNTHRPIDGTAMSALTNSLGIPALTIKIRLQEAQLRSIFTYMLANNLTSIKENILIYNNDSSITPLTTFFGPNSTYQSIVTKIPISITF